MEQLNLTNAVSILKNGGLVAFPTDTLYALGASSSIQSALERVYEAKGRPTGMPLPIFVSSAEEIENIAIDIPTAAWDLIDSFWPGPLTIILKRSKAVSDIITGGGDTVGIRMPDHPIALELIRSVGSPITGTSANMSGDDNPSSADHVFKSLGESVDLIIDGGECVSNGASTILDLSSNQPRIIRYGVLLAEDIERVCPGIIEA